MRRPPAIGVVHTLIIVTDQAGPSPQDEATPADAADSGSQSDALERESEQYGEASHEQEAEAEESVREADSDS